jgi:hypothetical protein
MLSTLLIDGNNLGHALGYFDQTTGLYDTSSLLAHLDGVARYLATQSQEVKVVLFLDDVSAAERLGGWLVQVAQVPDGDADAAIRAYVQAHADQPQILVSADQALCDDVAAWGAVCLSPRAFASRYLIPAFDAGVRSGDVMTGVEQFPEDLRDSDATQPAAQQTMPSLPEDQGPMDRQRHTAALERTGATLRGQPLPPPDVYRLDLDHWDDDAELALYLAEHHLCTDHPDLTDPNEMITTIRIHCSRHPRYFSSGRVIDRVFRLFLCRSEHTLSLDDLTRLAGTRRRKIRAAITRYGERLGIKTAW